LSNKTDILLLMKEKLKNQRYHEVSICEKENEIAEMSCRLVKLEQALIDRNSENEQLYISRENLKRELDADIEELKV
jgi:hypothetical protein